MKGTDKTNGYEDSAARFISQRKQTIGVAAVRHWAKTLPRKATVLDLGCGTGLPVSNVLMQEGMIVSGIDASPTMVEQFRRNFPAASVACEAAEDSLFFNRQFDAIVAWGLLFLLPAEVQATVLQKVAGTLTPGGKLLFTAPAQPAIWKDVLTGHVSTSLGSQKYKELLETVGLSLLEEFDDEGENHYYHAVKSETAGLAIHLPD